MHEFNATQSCECKTIWVPRMRPRSSLELLSAGNSQPCIGYEQIFSDDKKPPGHNSLRTSSPAGIWNSQILTNFYSTRRQLPPSSAWLLRPLWLIFHGDDMAKITLVCTFQYVNAIFLLFHLPPPLGVRVFALSQQQPTLVYTFQIYIRSDVTPTMFAPSACAWITSYTHPRVCVCCVLLDQRYILVCEQVNKLWVNANSMNARQKLMLSEASF